MSRSTRLLLTCVAAMIDAQVWAADPIDFVRTVAPLLQARCVSCHNSIDRKGAFSLQTRDELIDSGYVEPGRPNDSALIHAITPRNGNPSSMPKSGAPLTADDVAAVAKWIEMGAPWPAGHRLEEPVVENAAWWSFQPVVKRAPPPLKPHPIDAFIAEKLAEWNLVASPPADPRTLIRRLSFDLIGLPPTPDEVDAFVAESQRESVDARPSAYERLVDRLLASPRYGERWARHWLDVVKYADTAGYDKDKLRPNAWPYRDYVIRSINDDKPYARFVREQIAGDVLFPGTPDGILGLGFLAAGPWDWIGHAEVPESKIDGKIARHTDRDEMVSNTINTFCSVTIQCCQCHNHKFDPFTQEHYYNLQAVFAAVDKAERPYDLDPHFEAQRRDLEARRIAIRARLAELDADVKRDGGPELIALEQRVAELSPRIEPSEKRPEFGYHSAISPKPNVEKWVEIDLGRDVAASKVVLRPCHDDFNNIGAGFGFPVRFRVTGRVGDSMDWITFHSAESRDVPNPKMAPYEIEMGNRPVRHVRVTATHLAPRQLDFIFALAELQVFDEQGHPASLRAQVASLDTIEAPPRWGRANLVDGIWPTARDADALADWTDAARSLQALLDRINTLERVQQRGQSTQELNAAEAQLKSLPVGRMVHAAATDFTPVGTFLPTKGKPRAIHLLHRGNVLQPRSPSTPGTFPLTAMTRDASATIDGSHKETIDASGRFMLSPDQPEGDRRAALANWLTRTDHPLTWRSIVNRVWQQHFGRGLVETPNDLGRMGKPPTHPELLDWLAAEFRDNGQSFKALHKLIVMSETYRQSSSHHEANATVDAENRWLWRMTRRRLDAEEIRDAVLSVSGKLNLTMGGPGYYLFVLERPEHSPHYEYHKFNPEEVASHRRSIYRFVVRSQPDPYMTTLDCADSSQSTPQRNETLTSLQALSLLNNSFSLAMARHFAESVAASQPELNDRVDLAFRRISGRSPSQPEAAALTEYAREHGLANCCRLLFNLSEFVYVD